MARALEVPRAIHDGASGKRVSRQTLAELLERSPAASQFRKLVLASRAYGFTIGGVHAEHYDLSDLGRDATGTVERETVAAHRRAVLAIEPFRIFLESYDGKRVPSSAALRAFLIDDAKVPPDWAEDCMHRLIADATAVGFIQRRASGSHVQLDVTAAAAAPDRPSEHERSATGGTPTKVFVAHGTNHKPLTQLKRFLDQIKVEYAVAEDEPHGGRPISAKVAALMQGECSSAIFIFSADEQFSDEGSGGRTVWKPRENVVYELGAASVLYGRRIVIFKEEDVNFPSDFSDLGYIEFERDRLDVKTAELLKELMALDIIEIRYKGEAARFSM